MTKPKLKVLSLPGRPRQLAKDLWHITRTIRTENNARYFMLVTLNLDGDIDIWTKGHASQVEQLGVLALAKDRLLG